MLWLSPKSAPRGSSLVYLDISHGGEIYRIGLRRLASAQRYTLRVRAAKQEIILTMPARGSLKEAKCFAAKHAAWIGARLRRLPQRIPFGDGKIVPLRGILHTITHRAASRGAVWVEAAADCDGSTPLLCAGGDALFVERRIKDYFLSEAKKDIEAAVIRYAQQVGVSPRRISLRDPVSRWGSCSSSGALSFSWRLILAPPFVLDYLAAHEIAHLLHMNHSKLFWEAVERLTTDTRRAEAWLKTQGSGLHRFGPDP
ncbi:MAG: M48 family metallopeptidase [Methylocapsa sp.]|nr:M48 family metallopeptidase [Methylocapsa sp.]